MSTYIDWQRKEARTIGELRQARKDEAIKNSILNSTDDLMSRSESVTKDAHLFKFSLRYFKWMF